MKARETMKEITCRDMLRGNLELLLLSTLNEESKYGYLIQQSLREGSMGEIDVKAGTLYPILHKLEKAKLVKSRWDDSTGRRRKWYELTPSGRRQLKRLIEQWNRYSQCVERFLEPATG